MKPIIPVGVLAAGLLTLAFGLDPVSTPEKVFAPGSITPDELVKLDTGFAALEGGAADVAAFAATMPNNERGAELKLLAAQNVANAAAYRAGFAEAYLYDEVEEPPTDPTDPTDPKDPPVIDPGAWVGLGPDPEVTRTDWVFKLVDGGGKKGIAELPDKWAPVADGGNPLIENFSMHAASKGEYTSSGLASANFNAYDDSITARNFEVYWFNKWGSRQYGTRSNVVFEYGLFRDGIQEHAIYHNLVAMRPDLPLSTPCITVRKCVFLNIPGQVVQFVTRTAEEDWHETWDPEVDFGPGGWIILEDCYAWRVGIWDESERASFALSFFRSDHPVRVSRFTLDNSSLAEHSRGALLCEGGRPEFILEDSSFTVGTLFQPFMKFDDMDGPITIRNTSFEALGGQDHIDLRGCDGPITIEGCSGDTLIRVDPDGDGPLPHQVIGPVSAGYTQE